MTKTSQRLPLEEQYRPQRFTDFVGQRDAVVILSKLSRNNLRRHVLFKGDLGSGKTSAAQVYAAALFCEAKLSDGSPCCTCSACRDQPYYREFDTALLGGDVTTVRALLEQVDYLASAAGGAFAFFDECHVLTRDAVDLFLKRLEDPNSAVTYAFATTEPSKLKAPFLSRLMKITVHALTHVQAVSFLEHVAKREGIAATADALSLIAACEKGYPRAMLKALDQIWETDGEVSLDAVRSYVGRGHADHLVSFARSLASGSPRDQLHEMQNWPGRLADKLEALSEFLTTIYYNDILGADIVVSSLPYALKRERLEIAEHFRKRWRLSSVAELTPRWERMLEFWANRECRERTMLSLTVFQNLVNQGLDTPPSGNSKHPPGEKATSLSLQTTSWSRPAEDHGTFDKARAIVHAGSFFTQGLGGLLNAALVISPDSKLPLSVVESAVRKIRLKLRERFSNRSDTYGTITLFERQGVIEGRILAHIPDLHLDGIANDLKAFCAGHGGPLRLLIVPELCLDLKGDNASNNFHWRQILSACAGLVTDDDNQEISPMRELAPLVRSYSRSKRFTRLLSFEFDDALSKQAEELPFAHIDYSSAFDSGCFHAIASGWEQAEHQYRLKEMTIRQQQLEEVSIFASMPNRFHEEQQRLRSLWDQGEAAHRAGLIRSWKEL